MHPTADHLKRVLSRRLDRLGIHRDAPNRLNGHPVLDGDTGTNMQLTVGTVVDETSSAADTDLRVEIEDGGQPLHPCLISAG